MRFVLLAVFLAGCGLTPEGDALRAVVKERGADVYDAGVDNSIWFLCNPASVGSIRRRFAGRWGVYNGLCAESAMELASPPRSLTP